MSPGTIAGSVANGFWLAHLRGEAIPAPSQTDWAALLSDAGTHQLRGLTYRLVADGPFATEAPAEVLGKLHEAYTGTAYRNALLFRQTRQLVKPLVDRGIPVILLKGLHLARFVYPEPALRNMADVDIMVPRSSLAEAERAMLELGFGPVPRPDLEAFCAESNHLAKLFKDGAPVVEVHWTIERPTAPFPIDLDGLWSRSRAVELEGVPVRVLSPEDLVLHLVLHCSYHHRFDRSAFKALVDLDTVIRRSDPRLDWTVLAERARQWRATSYLYTTLRAVTEVIGSPVPAPWLRSLDHEGDDDAMVRVAVEHTVTAEPELPAPFLALAGAKSWRQRLAVMWEALVPPRAMLERAHGLAPGSPLAFGYYLLRPFDLAWRRGSLLWAAVRRDKTVAPALDKEARRERIQQWAGRGSGSAASGKQRNVENS
ncbi:MAG: nucleotidyltransferase family protein [Gemmatimonadales bacterium]